MRASGKARRRRHSSAIPRRRNRQVAEGNAAGGAQTRSNAIDISEAVHVAQINGFPESQTKDAFERAENRFLVVANKFQTGFHQPLLHIPP